MKRPMAAAAFSWGAGLVLSGAYAGRTVNIYVAATAMVVFSIVILHIVRKNSGSCMAYMLLPVLFMLGMFRAEAYGRELYGASDEIAGIYGENDGGCRMRGRVIGKDAKESEEGTIYVLTLDRVAVNSISLKGEAVVYVLQNVKIGSEVEASGEIGCFEKALNPGGFDAFSHYGYRGVYWHVYDGKVLTVQESKTLPDAAREAIFRFRVWMLQAIRATAPEDVYGFFQGILLGEKSFMEDEDRDSLRRSGLAHILTVSGLHISMMASMLMILLKRSGLPFSVRLPLGALVVGAYVCLTGAGYPSLRAYDMFLLSLAARLLGRTYDGKCALCACFLWRTINKPLLVFDPGFQLSFLSMAAILWFVPHVQALWIRNRAEGRRLRSMIRSALLTSWTVLTVISPVICYSYYETARYAMFLNLLILPVIGLLLLLLMAGLALAISAAVFVSSDLRAALSPAVLTARVILRVSRWFEHLPGNVCITGRPEREDLLLYFVFYGGGLVILCLASGLLTYGRRKNAFVGRSYLPDRRSFRTVLFLLIMISGLLLPNALKRRPPADTELIMLDVGQGDGFLFRFPNGENMLIDSGNGFREDLWDRLLKPALLYYGIDTIDVWLLTHFDMDHISAFVQREHEIAEEEKKDVCYEPYIRCRRILISSKDRIEELSQLCGRTPDPEVYKLSAGMSFVVGGAKAVCLNPDPSLPGTADNDTSVVIRMETGGHSLLFCADISNVQERRLLESGTDLSADILKVAHHGSRHSTSEAFAEAVSPRIALISVGKNNYGHPSPEVLTRLAFLGADIQMTDRKGAVILRLKDKIELRRYRP